MRIRVMAAVFAATVAGACSDSVRPPTQPETHSIPLVTESAQHAGVPHNHRTHLSGEEEVLLPPPPPGSPTPADSRAQGQAIIQIAPDGNSFDYKLIASNIVNVVQAHIHCGPAGQNGPIVVWLYPNPTATMALQGPQPRHDGVLATGTIVEGAELHVRPVPANHAVCTGGVATFDDVVAKIRAGEAYVNVHTNDGVAPTNTGPGDFPGGEIRGQLR